jgi:hypothetical protein
MIKALKVTMIVWGILGILSGLAFIFIPLQLGDMFGFEHGPVSTLYLLGMLGTGMIAPSVFLIAAARDPLRHIYWVKFAILGCLLTLAIALYSLVQGFVSFSQVGMDIIMFAVFAAAFLVFYPWRAARSSK